MDKIVQKRKLESQSRDFVRNLQDKITNNKKVDDTRAINPLQSNGRSITHLAINNSSNIKGYKKVVVIGYEYDGTLGGSILHDGQSEESSGNFTINDTQSNTISAFVNSGALRGIAELRNVNVVCEDGVRIPLCNCVGSVPVVSDELYYYVDNPRGSFWFSLAVNGLGVFTTYNEYDDIRLGSLTQLGLERVLPGDFSLPLTHRFLATYQSNSDSIESEVSISGNQVVIKSGDSSIVVDKNTTIVSENLNIDDENLSVTLSGDTNIASSNVTISDSELNVTVGSASLYEMDDAIIDLLETLFEAISAGLTSPSGPVTIPNPQFPIDWALSITSIKSKFNTLFNKSKM